MSSGRAGQGSRAKQSHDSGQVDSAATTPSSPEDLLDNEQGYPFDEEGAEATAAIERPNDHFTSSSDRPGDPKDSR